MDHDPDRAPDHATVAREMFNLPPEWIVMAWRVVGDPLRPSGIAVTGAVCPEVFQRGPRKGLPNWAKRDRATELTVSVPDTLVKERQEQWERSTGKCKTCHGTGQEWASWEAGVGVKYRGCKRCKATGKAPEAHA